MIVSLALFTQLAAACAPSVHVDTLAAIAQTESGFQNEAINDNSASRRLVSRSRDEAIASATQLVTVQGHSVDLGLMQINSANLARLGLVIADAFDPCRSLEAAARLLASEYRSEAAKISAQPALLRTLSRYNTGDPVRGFANGYVAKVQASLDQVVPALRPSDTAALRPDEPMPTRPVPPAWDVFAQARYARQQVTFATPPAAGASAPPLLPTPTTNGRAPPS